MNDAQVPDTVEPKKPKTTLASAAKQVMAPAMSEIVKALPQSLNPEKFEAAFVTAVISNSDILQCTPGSLRSALLKSAADGQLPDGRHAAIVPHFNTKKGVQEATYMPMVKGIVNKAAELGGVNSITAEVVYENDTFHANLADPADTVHSFAGWADNDRGEVVGAYAIFRIKGGEVVHREIMSKADINKARNVSRLRAGTVWNHWYTEMARKTVIRRGSKYVAMSPELAHLIQRDDEHVVFEKDAPDNYNPLAEKDGLDEVIEGTAQEVDPASEDDKEMSARLCSEVDEIDSVEVLREWQGDWADVIENLHVDCAKLVRDTINVKFALMEKKDG